MQSSALLLALLGGWDMLAVSTGPRPSFDMLAPAAQPTGGTSIVSHRTPAGRRTLVVYTAEWCEPCRRLEAEVLPRLAAAGWRIGAGERDHIRVEHLAGPVPDGVDALPTFVLRENGRELRRHTGLLDAWEIGEFFKGYSERPVQPPDSGPGS